MLILSIAEPVEKVIEPEVVALEMNTLIETEKVELGLINLVLFILPLIVISMSIIIVVMWLWLRSEQTHSNRYNQFINKAKDMYAQVNKGDSNKPIFQMDNESLLKNSDSMNDLV